MLAVPRTGRPTGFLFRNQERVSGPRGAREQDTEGNMERRSANWSKAIFWGAITALLYATMFYNADLIIELARTTPETPWHVLVPIGIAFAISWTHGAFTGLFWELMGLKPATRKG